VIKDNHEDQEENAKKSLGYGKLVVFIIGNKKMVSHEVNRVSQQNQCEDEINQERLKLV
jgi:hypothetical protein